MVLGVVKLVVERQGMAERLCSLDQRRGMGTLGHLLWLRELGSALEAEAMDEEHSAGEMAHPCWHYLEEGQELVMERRSHGHSVAGLQVKAWHRC